MDYSSPQYFDFSSFMKLMTQKRLIYVGSRPDVLTTRNKRDESSKEGKCETKMKKISFLGRGQEVSQGVPKFFRFYSHHKVRK